MTVESPGLVPESPGASPGDVVACGDFCWVEPYVCQDCCSVDVNDADPRLRETARLWASRFLWTATGKQYGGCPRTYRPCRDRKSTRLNSSHVKISYAVFCLKKK